MLKKKNSLSVSQEIAVNSFTTSTTHTPTLPITTWELGALGKHLWRDSHFNLIQLIDPHFQTLRQTPDLLPGQHPRLHPRDNRVLLDLVERACDELEADRKKENIG